MPLLPVFSGTQECAQEAGDQLEHTSRRACQLEASPALGFFTVCGYYAPYPETLGIPRTRTTVQCPVSIRQPCH